MNTRLILMLCLCGALGACATTTEKPRATAEILVDEQVGFTISEPVTVDGEVRAEYEHALLLLEQGELDRGIALLQGVVDAAPEVSGPRIDLGVAWHRKGDLEAAEKHLLKALELNPEHPVAHNELGIVYRKTGRFAEARNSYEAALSVFPNYHHARRNLGVLCDLYLGDPECALEAYEAYMATVPEDAEAAMWIVDLRNRTGRQE